jgi:ketosteroid isomerase-like protein
VKTMFDNTEFVSSLYAAFGRGDVQTILDACDPAIEWVSNCGDDAIPWGGTRSGPAGVLSFFRALEEHLAFEAFEPQRFLDAGNAVTVLGRTRARSKSGGRGMFDSEWAHVFTIADGRVTRFQEFYDTAAIQRALAA